MACCRIRASAAVSGVDAGARTVGDVPRSRVWAQRHARGPRAVSRLGRHHVATFGPGCELDSPRGVAAVLVLSEFRLRQSRLLPGDLRLGRRLLGPWLAVLGILLVCFGGLTADAGLAVPAVAGDGGSSGPPTRQVEPAAPAPHAQTTKKPRERQQCQRGGNPREYLGKQHTQAPSNRDHATVMRTGLDHLEWVVPGLFRLPRPRAVPANTCTTAQAAVGQRSHRTFDGRAPPQRLATVIPAT